AMLIASLGLETDCYASGREFLDGYDRRKAGCAILDFQLPGLTGLDIQQALNASESPLPVIFITGRGNVSFAAQAMRSGAIDVLVKPVVPDVLLARVQEGMQLDLVRRQTNAFIANVRDRLCRLTRREREIANLLAAGESCKQIARRLEICHKTVDNH